MSAPQVTIDLASDLPVRRQIVDQLRAALVERLLEPGAELPSVRRLALELGVHFNTVAEAYRILAEDGWLEVSAGRSTRVRTREPQVAPAGAIDPFRQRLRLLIAELRAQGVAPTSIAHELALVAEGLKS